MNDTLPDPFTIIGLWKIYSPLLTDQSVSSWYPHVSFFVNEQLPGIVDCPLGANETVNDITVIQEKEISP